jgi:hypothetical protein
MADDTKRKDQIQRAVCPLRRKVAPPQQTSQRGERLDVEMLGNIELGDGGKLMRIAAARGAPDSKSTTALASATRRVTAGARRR